MTASDSELDPFDSARSRFLARMPQHFERLDWDASQLRAFQEERLRDLLAAAISGSPYHARRLAGIDLASFGLADLPSLPVMTKPGMMANYDEATTDRRITRAAVERHLATIDGPPTLFLDEYLVLASGGSSGVRGMFAYHRDSVSEYMSGVLRGGIRRVSLQMGWPLPMRLPVVLAAAPSGIHATRATAILLDGTVANVTFAPATLPFDELVRTVQAAQPMLLAGYTSTVARLADEQAAGRLSIQPRMIIVTSEQLTPELQARIARGFGMPPANSFASSEGLFGSAPPGSDVFDFASDLAIIEFVDANDRPVPAGEPADHVLVTNLFNHVQPLIRYRLDDRMCEAEPSPAHGHQRATLEGRGDEHLVIAGTQVHPLTIRSAMLKHPAVIEYQVISRSRSICLAVVAGREFDTTGLAQQVRSALAAAGADNVEVVVGFVDALQRDPRTGKVRRFISEGA